MGELSIGPFNINHSQLTSKQMVSIAVTPILTYLFIVILTENVLLSFVVAYMLLQAMMNYFSDDVLSES